MEKVELFLGRFQPVHNGHLKIIKKMNNPVVVLVKGSKTGEDKKRNPFTIQDQLRWFKKLLPSLEVSVSPNGFLPGIIGYLRKQGKEVTVIYAGEDRIIGYKAAIEAANKKNEEKIDVAFKTTPRFASATEVRTALLNNDSDKFKKLMPQELWGDFSEMRKKIKESHSLNIKSFKEWLDEEDTTTAVSTTENIENVDRPLGKRVVRRKKKKEE